MCSVTTPSHHHTPYYMATFCSLLTLSLLLPHIPPSQPYHMSAAALNALHNIILQKKYGMEGVTISVNNYPLPKGVDDEVPTRTITHICPPPLPQSSCTQHLNIFNQFDTILGHIFNHWNSTSIACGNCTS